MTAEVVVCNTLGVALAADSAATVRAKVLNSANKVFALTKHYPVGVMISDSSALSAVPWEVLIKEYRTYINSKGFPHLRQYAESFFHFINSNPKFFDEDYVQAEIRSRIVESIERLIEEISESANVPRASLVRQREEFGKKIDEFYAAVGDIAKFPYVPGLDRKKAQANFLKMTALYENVADQFQNLISSKRRRQRLMHLMNAAVTQQTPRRASSSLVFAGFGQNDIFPAVCQYHCDGFFGGVTWRRMSLEHSVTSLNRAAIIPFAQDDVVKTFIDGIDPDLSQAVQDFVREFARNVKSVVNPAAGNAIDTFVNEFFRKFGQYRNAHHVRPLIDMVAVLPVDELAQLAESLVSITSLKRHISQDLETVGGPIDVAVITRGDGLVWVKRKHYFDAVLNPDYFARQRAAAERV